MPKTIKIEVPDWLYKIVKKMVKRKSDITFEMIITQYRIEMEKENGED